jgi:DNA invertase Pin-like site-specific DNA recombinase
VFEERQMAGIAAAKAVGIYKGRPATIDGSAVRALRAQGMGAADIPVYGYNECMNDLMLSHYSNGDIQ